jgi:hypothetical protein
VQCSLTVCEQYFCTGRPPEPRAARKSCLADFVCTVGVSGFSMPVFQAVRGEFKSRTVHHFVIQFRRSNQGECTALLMRMEAGSIPAAGANLACEASSGL